MHIYNIIHAHTYTHTHKVQTFYYPSGASSDVEMASRLARAMVTKYAMSDVVSINKNNNLKL